MKETSPLRQVSGPVYPPTRDLDIVFEENDHSQQQQSVGYQPSPPLNFLRPKPNYSTPYSPSTTTTAPTSIPTPATTTNSSPNMSLPTMRRPRAGTMPSFLHPEISNTNRPNANAAFLLNTIEAGRHRSGSLNLPPVDFWPLRHDAPLSPSSEQLLQNDSDFSIARTMRSLGLEDEQEEPKKEPLVTSLFHQQTPPEFLLPSRSLLSGSNRNRSYSVNATAKYEPPVEQKKMNFASPLEGFTRQQLRPRASSMGRADAVRLGATAMLWANNTATNNARSSPLVSMEEEVFEQSISLGDSELLANMLRKEDEVATTAPVVPVEKPYLNYSQSTPTTLRESNLQQPTQVTSRSLWVGNIDASVTIDILNQVFSSFGPIESIRLLTEKECGFVNFFSIEDAIRAKEEVLGNMGGRIGQCIVRIGYGKADAAVTETNNSQPTRALWLGNIPGNTTPTSLQGIFAVFGHIESVRVLSHKNCGFINFDTVESAVKARDALLSNDMNSHGFSGARVGFAKIPPSPPPTSGTTKLFLDGEEVSMDYETTLLMDATIVWQNELVKILQQFNMEESLAKSLVKDLKISSMYFDNIPAVPELSANRKFDSNRLKEMRKRIDSATDGQEESEAVAAECMEDIAEICSDYIGNTIVQRLFEKCSEDTKTRMLKRIGPHLAAISVHKNGTWATQKIIDLAKTPEQIQLINFHIKPFIPPLLLDQFGNYAVQCCLRLGDNDTQYIFDAMVEKLMNIAQGRFGARSMRGILEGEYVSENQKKFVAASLCQNALPLSTNANGALLLSWLIESTDIEHRLECIASRLTPHLTQLCIHKLGSQIIYKLVNQNSEPKAQELIITQLFADTVLADILADQVRGLVFIQKLLSCPSIQHYDLKHRVSIELETLNGPGHKKLKSQLLDNNK